LATTGSTSKLFLDRPDTRYLIDELGFTPSEAFSVLDKGSDPTGKGEITIDGGTSFKVVGGVTTSVENPDTTRPISSRDELLTDPGFIAAQNKTFDFLREGSFDNTVRTPQLEAFSRIKFDAQTGSIQGKTTDIIAVFGSPEGFERDRFALQAQVIKEEQEENAFKRRFEALATDNPQSIVSNPTDIRVVKATRAGGKSETGLVLVGNRILDFSGIDRRTGKTKPLFTASQIDGFILAEQNRQTGGEITPVIFKKPSSTISVLNSATTFNAPIIATPRTETLSFVSGSGRESERTVTKTQAAEIREKGFFELGNKKLELEGQDVVTLLPVEFQTPSGLQTINITQENAETLFGSQGDIQLGGQDFKLIGGQTQEISSAFDLPNTSSNVTDLNAQISAAQKAVTSAKGNLSIGRLGMSISNKSARAKFRARQTAARKTALSNARAKLAGLQAQKTELTSSFETDFGIDRPLSGRLDGVFFGPSIQQSPSLRVKDDPIGSLFPEPEGGPDPVPRGEDLNLLGIEPEGGPVPTFEQPKSQPDPFAIPDDQAIRISPRPTPIPKGKAKGKKTRLETITEKTASRRGRTIAARDGFEGFVNKPTMFLAGEAGREHVKITPMKIPKGNPFDMDLKLDFNMFNGIDNQKKVLKRTKNMSFDFGFGGRKQRGKGKRRRKDDFETITGGLF